MKSRGHRFEDPSAVVIVGHIQSEVRLLWNTLLNLRGLAGKVSAVPCCGPSVSNELVSCPRGVGVFSLTRLRQGDNQEQTSLLHAYSPLLLPPSRSCSVYYIQTLNWL